MAHWILEVILQRTQITAYVTEEEFVMLKFLAAASQLTASGWIGQKINNAFRELYGFDAKPFAMESVIKNSSGKHSVKCAGGKTRRSA